MPPLSSLVSRPPELKKQLLLPALPATPSCPAGAQTEGPAQRVPELRLCVREAIILQLVRALGSLYPYILSPQVLRWSLLLLTGLGQT